MGLAKHGQRRTFSLGKYELIANIGAGGMAEVYLARQSGPMGFSKLVVVKVIRREMADDEDFVKMFLDEARIAAQISHPNVVQVFDLGEENKRYFIVMEYLPGESLSAILRASRLNDAALTPEAAIYIVARAAEGLHAAHELMDPGGELLDVVHRDVTPSNIIVLYDGTVRLVDFGVAKARGRLTQTVGSGLKGKIAYLSPEQIRGKVVDRRSDIFSLGIVMWEALVGRRLYKRSNEGASMMAIATEHAPPPSRLVPGVPEGIDEVVSKALAKNPDQRYQTAEQMRRGLERCIAPDIKNRGIIPAYMEMLFSERIANRKVLLARIASAEDIGGELDISSIEMLFRGEGSSSTSLPVPPDVAEHTVQDLGPPRSARGPLSALLRPVPLITGGGALVLALGALVLSAPGDRESVPVSGPSSPVPAQRAVEVTPTAPTQAPAQETGKLTEPPPLRVLAPQTRAAPQPPPPRVPSRETEEPAPTPPIASSLNSPSPKTREPVVHGSVARSPREPRRKKPKTRTPPAKRNPVKAKALCDEGFRLYVAGRIGPAERKFRQSIAADSKYAPAYRGLGLVAEAQKKNARAIVYLEKYLNLAPGGPDASSIRARVSAMRR